MFGTYWNDASVLRAALIKAGVPADTASVVSMNCSSRTEAWWNLASGRMVAALPMLLSLALAGYCYSVVSVNAAEASQSALPELGSVVLIAPAVAPTSPPELLLFSYFLLATFVGGLASRLLARVWPSYRHALFVLVVMRRKSGDGIGLPGRAIRRAEGTSGSEFVRRTLSYHEQLYAVGTAVVLAVIAAHILFGQGYFGAFGREKLARVPAGPAGQVEVFSYSDVLSISADCKWVGAFRMPAHGQLRFEVRILGRPPIILGRQTPAEEAVLGAAWLRERLMSVAQEEGRTLPSYSKGSEACFANLKQELPEGSRAALDVLRASVIETQQR